MQEQSPEKIIPFIGGLSSSYMAGRNADVVVCALGEPPHVTGEAHSVTSIEIPEMQKQLLIDLKKQGKPVVGVLFFGRPVALQSVEPYLDAIVLMWHGGVEATHTAAKIIFGDAEPTGRLPVTFPRVTGQIPLYYNALPGGRDMNGYYGEDNKVVHNYEDCSGTPMYPFGYGLTYTDFKYSEITVLNHNFKIEDLMNGRTFKLCVKVTNIGQRDGTETVQLYIHDKLAGRVRPLRELKSFRKLKIKSGDSQTVSFELGYSELGYYLENGEYTVEPGEFEIYIGRDCLTKNSVIIRLN